MLRILPGRVPVADLCMEEAQAIGVASRRLAAALAESDDVDRYCDLWEACELATLYEKGARAESWVALLKL